MKHLYAVYHILYQLIAAASYYKFQVEKGAVTNQDFYIEIACKAAINYGFNFVLYGAYPSVTTICGTAINQ